MSGKRVIQFLLTLSLIVGGAGYVLNKPSEYKNTIVRKIDQDNNLMYTGEIDFKGVNNLYLVEIENFQKERELYLTIKSKDNFLEHYRFRVFQYEILGTNVEITDTYRDNMNERYNSDYGKVMNIIPFNQYVSLYGQIKEIYNAQEIIDIFNLVKENYDVLSVKEEIRRLTLK